MTVPDLKYLRADNLNFLKPVLVQQYQFQHMKADDFGKQRFGQCRIGMVIPGNLMDGA